MAKLKKETALLWVFVIAAILSAWRFIIQPWQQRETATPALETMVPSPNSTSGSTPAVEEAISVKTASVKTSYKNPGGADEVGFSVSVDESGVITQATVEVLAKNPTSIQRQKAFAAELPQAIQGKKLSDLTTIDKVGGSSLTTEAFNASLAQLKAGI